MTDMNCVHIIGRLVRNGEFFYLNTGTALLKITIASNRSRKDGEKWVDDVSYFDVTVWGKQAENIKQYCEKGKQIAVEGYLKQDRWEKDGQKHSKISIVASQVQLLIKGESGLTKCEAVPAQRFIRVEKDNISVEEANSGVPEDLPF